MKKLVVIISAIAVAVVVLFSGFAIFLSLQNVKSTDNVPNPKPLDQPTSEPLDQPAHELEACISDCLDTTIFKAANPDLICQSWCLDEIGYKQADERCSIEPQNIGGPTCDGLPFGIYFDATVGKCTVNKSILHCNVKDVAAPFGDREMALCQSLCELPANNNTGSDKICYTLEECALIEYVCPEGWNNFISEGFGDCTCGCVVPEALPDPLTPEFKTPPFDSNTSGSAYDTSGSYCESDDDCTCQVFNGADFFPSGTPFRCDLSKNECEKCLYF